MGYGILDAGQKSIIICQPEVFIKKGTIIPADRTKYFNSMIPPCHTPDKPASGTNQSLFPYYTLGLFND
jgi:hypothetical protein